MQAASWGLTFKNLPPASAASAPVTITLWRPTTLRVPFIDKDGKPVPGLAVRIRALFGMDAYLELPAEMQDLLAAKTDSDGEAVFTGLPKSSEGPAFAARISWDDAAFAVPDFSRDTVSVPETGTEPTPPVRLLPGSQVEGRIATSDGTPQAGVHVRISPVAVFAPRMEAITDSQGNYRISSVRPGTYNITLFLDGEREKNVTACALERVQVKEGATLGRQDFTLIT